MDILVHCHHTTNYLALERSLSDLRRSKLGVTLGPEHAAWRREELAGVIEAVGEVRSGLRQAQEECLAAELEAARDADHVTVATAKPHRRTPATLHQGDDFGARPPSARP